MPDRVADSARFIWLCTHSTYQCAAQQYLHKNCPLMTEKEQWPLNKLSKSEYHGDIMFGEWHKKLFWTLLLKPKTVSEFKSRTGQFLTGPVKKAVLSSINSWIEYVKGDGRHSEHFSLFKKCLHFWCLQCLEHSVETVFDNTTTARSSW